MRQLTTGRSGPARRQHEAKRNRNRAQLAAIAANAGSRPLTSRLMGDPARGRSALERRPDHMAQAEPVDLFAVPLLEMTLIEDADDPGELGI